MSNKINRNTGEPDKKGSDLRKKILTALILAVIALEVVLILYFIVKRSMRPAQQPAAAESTQADSTTEEYAEDVVLKDVTINWHGQERTVKAAEDQTDYTGLKIDFGDSDWWVEEGFVGQYTMTEKMASVDGVTEEFSELIIYENGNVVWVTDDAVYSGELMANRYYGDAAHGYVKSEEDQMPRSFDLSFVKAEEDGSISEYAIEEETDQNVVKVYCSEQTDPDPLDEICVYLERIEE